MLNKIKEFDKIVIQCHDNPDPDALACAFAMSAYLKAFGKETKIIYSGFSRIVKANLILMQSELGIEVNFIPKTDTETTIPKDTLLLLVDCQYGAGNVKKISASNIGVIDHHIQEKNLANFADVRPFLGSCATLCWYLLKEDGFDFDNNKKVATALYYGLYTDTNSLSEITHPLDKDARDSLKFDKALIKRLNNTNITLNDLNLAGKSLISNNFNPDNKSAVFYAEPCDPNILGFISDLALQVDHIDTCIVFCEVSGGVKISVRSCVREVMANELAATLCEGGGSGGGHADKAGGFISRDFIDSKGVTPFDYLINKHKEYFLKYDLIYASNYQPNLTEFKIYKKSNIPVGFVKTTDLFESGTEMIVRTLEGDANIVSSEDTYIMVGVKEEIYPIKRVKFEKTYKVMDGKYVPHSEFFESNHYSPMVKAKIDGEMQDIKECIHPCVSTGEVEIYAKQLKKHTKVFTSWDYEGYMHGRPGDYIAVRLDDTGDAYIIEKTIFDATYKEV